MVSEEQKVLASTVHVVNENGDYLIVGPGEEVPEWALGQVTNPAAWTDGSNFVANPHREPMFDAQNMGR